MKSLTDDMPKKSLIKRIIQKRKDIVHSDTFCSKKALNALNISQFLGVINDNVFKFLTVFLLIDLRGIEHSSSILFWVGTVYVLPFLLFSSAAGVLADKISKQKLIVALKGLEVVITILGVAAFAYQSAWSCYSLLFLLSFQSAVFGPPKYSIIPEIVQFDKISKANGVITSFTYLAMIVGTFLASFTTQVTNRNFTISAALCVIIAIVGFIASLYIPHTKPSRTQKRIKLFFLREIYQTLRFCHKTPHLLTSALCAAFFLYMGAFFQLNIIPYAIESLGLSEYGGGYLFLTISIGIAGGAMLAGKISKNRVELGLSCCSGVFLFLFLFLLAVSPKTIFTNLILLICIGAAGGCFIVPFDAYLQTFSPDIKRGQVIAASNFLSFTGVLMAPFSLYVFSGTFGLSAAKGFFIVSMLILVGSFFTIFYLSKIFLNFIGRRIFSLVYEVKLLHSPFEDQNPSLIIMKDSSMTKTLLLSGCSEDIHFFILRNKPRILDFFYRLFSSINGVYLSNMKKSLESQILSQVKGGKFPVLLLSKSLDLSDIDEYIESLGSTHTLYMHVKKPSKKDITKRHRLKEVVFSFEESP
ncbi:MAG: Lysophospholipid transporter LplT [Chlamydiia bacterium]|nr:Lysophospholipid transporter LplT [Chlamydiia bacterium]